MRSRLIVVATLLVLQVPHVAEAGGWWDSITVDRFLAPGQSVEAGGEFLFETIEEASASRDRRYFAYLLEGADHDMVDEAMGERYRKGWWKPNFERAYLLGPVEISNRDSNLAHASANFEVPALEPGGYDLMFCSDNCAEALGHMIPARVEVVADPVVARTATAFRDYRFRSSMSHRGTDHELRGLRKDLKELRGRMERVEDEIAQVRELLRDEKSDRSAQADALPVLLAGAGVLALVPLRRRWVVRKSRGSGI